VEVSERLSEFERKQKSRKQKSKNVLQGWVQNQYADPDADGVVPAFLTLVQRTPTLATGEEALKAISSFGVILRSQKELAESTCAEIAGYLTPEHVSEDAVNVGMEFLVRAMHFSRNPVCDNMVRQWLESISECAEQDPSLNQTKDLLLFLMSIPRELPFDWIRPPFSDLNSLRENVFLLPATTYDISPYLMRFRHKLKEQCDIEEAKDSDKFRVFAWLCGCSYVDMLWAYYYIIGDDEFLRQIVEIVLFSEKRFIVRDDNEMTLVAWMNSQNFAKLQEDFSFDRDSHVNICVSQYALRSLIQNGLQHNLVADIIQNYRNDLEGSQQKLMSQTYEALKFIARGPGFKKEESHEQAFAEEDD